MEQMQIPKNQMMNQNINNGGMNMGQYGYNNFGMPVAPTQSTMTVMNPNMSVMNPGMASMVNQPNMAMTTPIYNQQNQIVRPIAPTIPNILVAQQQVNQFGMPTNPMMNGYANGYNQYNNFGMPVTPTPTVQPMSVMNPNQFNATTSMANTTPMATQPMMDQNSMARTNPMMSSSVMNPQMGMMNPQLGMTQPNMNMMNGYANGYNQYNNFGMQTPTNPMMGRPSVPGQMPAPNNSAYNNYGMPMNQTNQMANQYGMIPQQTTMMNQTPVSKQELMEKLEKDLPRKKECKDFTFIVTRTNETYIFFKRRNTEWIKKFSWTLWNGWDIKFICEGDVIYIPLAVNSYEEFISDNELLIFLEKLRPNFFLKKLVRSDFIKINDEIFCINSDNLLEKYEKYEPSYFFVSPEKNKLVQDFCNALNNDSYLFIDEKTQQKHSFDSLPRLKALEDHFEEIKDYEG